MLNLILLFKHQNYLTKTITHYFYLARRAKLYDSGLSVCLSSHPKDLKCLENISKFDTQNVIYVMVSGLIKTN